MKATEGKKQKNKVSFILTSAPNSRRFFSSNYFFKRILQIQFNTHAIATRCRRDRAVLLLLLIRRGSIYYKSTKLPDLACVLTMGE